MTSPRSDGRGKHQVGLSSEIKGQPSGIDDGNADQADHRSDNRAKHAEQKALGHEQGHNFARQCTDGGNCQISLIRSYTAMIITFMILTSTMATSMILIKSHEINHLGDIVKW